MNDLIKSVTEKTGLNEEQARKAADAVLSFLKERLPAPIAGQLDGVLGQGGGGSSDALKGIGSKFGL